MPVKTFRDIGNSASCGIWMHQRVGRQNRFIKHIEGWGEPCSLYVREMQALGSQAVDLIVPGLVNRYRD